MSRSGYSDDCDNLALYRNAVTRAIHGKRGQAFLRDLRAALDALPEKTLVYGTLRDEATGRVCALGAVGVKRGLTLPEITPDDDGESSHELGKLFDIASSLAAEVQYVNDGDDYWKPMPETGEARYTRVSNWVDRQLRSDGAALARVGGPDAT